jgi:Zn-dependent metalloprotease
MPRDLTVCVLAICLLLAATSANAFVPQAGTMGQAAEEVRMNMVRTPPTNNARDRWGGFVKANGEAWEAVWNPVTDTPHRVYGRGIRLAAAVSPDNVERLIGDFVESNARLLGAEPDHLQLVSREKHGARWYADFQQVYEGLEVVGGRVHVRLKEDGNVTAFGSDFYRDVSVSTVPSIVEEDAVRLASDEAGFDPRTDRMLSSELLVLPLTRAASVEYHLAYRIRLRVEAGPAIWRTYVDAHTGDILQRSNEIYYDTISGTVTGYIKPMYITEPDQEEAFSHENVSVTGYGQATTDDAGYYAIEAGAGGLRELTAQLQGTWATVSNLNGGEASFEDSVAPGAGRDIFWNDSRSRADERNAYYHACVAHDKIKDIDPSFTGMDRQTPVRVNETDYCNAYWDGNGVTLGAGSGTCENLAMFSDVIYHEYGHGITDFLYRPYAPSGAMHEAFSDYFACTITDEPLIGEGVVGGGYFRTLANTLRYPEDLTGEVHDDSRILSGALWELRQALAPDIRLADSLFHYARYGKADNFVDYFYDVLETDDDDGNLTNGTPHYYEILEAFGNHGIGPGLTIEITHSPLKDTEDPETTFPVVATISGTLAPDPDSILVYYATGGPYSLLTMVATENAGEYTATIPAQPVGTTVEYYIYAKAQGRDEYETHPAGAPSNLHTFRVGTDSEAPVIVHTPMFDQPDAGWPATVAATVTDNLGLASVVLEYTKNGTPQTPVPMTNVPGTDGYEAAFDVGASAGDFIEYRIVATDASAASNSAVEPSAGYYFFAVAQAYHFTFETGDEGWTHYAPSGWNDEWHLSTQRNHTAGGGPSWKCGSTGSGAYANHQKALLETPLVNIGENARLTFWHWIDMESYEAAQGSGIAWDGAALTLVDSTGSGTSIDPVGGYPYRIIPGSEAPFTDNKPCYSGSAGWKMEVYDLSWYTGPARIRFKFGTDNYAGAEGWYIDDVMIWSTTGTLAGVDGCPDECAGPEVMPVRFSLGPALPNPTSGHVSIAYAVPSPGSHVAIKVFDITGRLAASLVDEHKLPGRYNTRWDGENTGGAKVAPGIYFIRMESRDFTASSKVILIR